MLLQHKETGKKYKVISGVIKPMEEVQKDKEITGAFLTLENLENAEDQELYIWPYYGDKLFDVVEE